MVVTAGQGVRRWSTSLCEWLSLAAMVLLILATVDWLAGFIQRNADYAFDSDEAVHAYEALRVSAYLRDGDVGGALDSTLRQSFYPPIPSWLLGLVLTVVGATHTTARLFSLAIYAVDALLLYVLARRLARNTHRPWLAGVITTISMLIAPPMWVVGALVYLELLGVLFVLIAFWGYWQGVEGRNWGWLVAGLGIVAAGLTKYVYGLFLIVPLPLALAMCSRPARRVLIRRLTLVALPLTVVALVWVAWPITRSGLADYIAATRQLAKGAQFSPLYHFTFYLGSVWSQFSPSPLMAAGLAMAFLASIVRWRDEWLRPLVVFFVWHLVGISAHGGLAPRFLTTAMPALWLMGGVGVARVADVWQGWMAQCRVSSQRYVAWLMLALAAVVLVVTTVSGLIRQQVIYPTLYMLSLETDSRAADLYQWTAAWIAPGAARIGLVNDWDQMSGLALGWELTTQRTRTPHKADLVAVWEMHRLPDPTPENVAALQDQMNARGLNYLVAYTAPGVGVKRLQGTVAALDDRVRLLGQRDFDLRWYWPEKLDHRLYNGEFLDEGQLQQALENSGTDRGLTVHVYAYTP